MEQDFYCTVQLHYQKILGAFGFQTGCFQIKSRSRSTDLEKKGFQPRHILQGVSLLLDAACTPDSSDELCCSGFPQLPAHGLITQVKSRADKGMKTAVKIHHLWMSEIIFTPAINSCKMYASDKAVNFKPNEGSSPSK